MSDLKRIGSFTTWGESEHNVILNTELVHAKNVNSDCSFMNAVNLEVLTLYSF